MPVTWRWCNRNTHLINDQLSACRSQHEYPIIEGSERLFINQGVLCAMHFNFRLARSRDEMFPQLGHKTICDHREGYQKQRGGNPPHTPQTFCTQAGSIRTEPSHNHIESVNCLLFLCTVSLSAGEPWTRLFPIWNHDTNPICSLRVCYSCLSYFVRWH